MKNLWVLVVVAVVLGACNTAEKSTQVGEADGQSSTSASSGREKVTRTPKALPALTGTRFEGSLKFGGESATLKAPGLALDLPSDALAQTVTIEAYRREDKAPASHGPYYELEPSGLTFTKKPRLTLEMPKAACNEPFGWVLGTQEEGRWVAVKGSKFDREACTVSGELAHFSPYAPLPEILAQGPLPADTQRYIIESILEGTLDHDSDEGWMEFRPSDGLLTVGLSRWEVDPNDPFVDICLVGGTSERRDEARPVIENAVFALSDENLEARFLPSNCYDEVIDTCGDCGIDCPSTDLREKTIYAFLSNVNDTQASCFAPGSFPLVENISKRHVGQPMIGGLVYLSWPLIDFNPYTVMHEFGHMFGLQHNWGGPDQMSYNQRVENYVDFEKLAFHVQYSVPIGTGLRELITMGVIEDTPDIFAQAPSIDGTIIEDSSDSARVDTENVGAVGERVLLNGRRFTLPFQSEYSASFTETPTVDERPVGYAPPIVRFGSIETVPNLDYDYQKEFSGDPGPRPAGKLSVIVPPGVTPGSSVSIERYDGRSFTFSGFAIDSGVTPPPAASTPNAPTLTCSPTNGGAELSWTLPARYLDGSTVLNPSGVTAQVFYNGFPLLDGDTPVELPGGTTSHTDAETHPDWETGLYQVVLVDTATGQAGVPSTVCKLTPRRTSSEIAVFMIDATGSMASVRADGSTRFESVVGDLPNGVPGVPRAFAAAAEVFARGGTPRVAVFAFDSQRGVVDYIDQLTGDTFTSDPDTVEEALVAIRDAGTAGQTPLADAFCFSGDFLFNEVENSSTNPYATLRVFTDGEENFSVGIPECPAECHTTGEPGSVEWDPACRPGECPDDFGIHITPQHCSACQVALFDTYCPVGQADAGSVNVFVEYFGFGGPFSPLPADSGFFLDLARASGGTFAHNADTGERFVGSLAKDLPPIISAGEDQEFECTGPAGVVVPLVGFAMDDDPEDILTYEWFGPDISGGHFVGRKLNLTLPIGVHPLELRVRDEHQVSRDGVSLTVVDTVPPVVTPPAAVQTSACGNRTVTLGTATATDLCGGTLPVTGQVVARDGVALATPIPVTGGQTTLNVGVWTVRWSANDGYNVGSATQTVTVTPRIQAAERFLVDDRAALTASGGAFASVVNSGALETRIGYDARVGAIFSRAPVQVLDRATVAGGISSAGAINVSSQANVSGPRLPFTTLTFPPLPTLPTFPNPVGPNITINAGTSRTLNAGSYPTVILNSQGTLVLGAGDYFFRDLTLNSAATVRVATNTRVFVANTFAFRSPFTASNNTVRPIFLGYRGTNLVVETRFDGTLVAPNAFVAFGIGSGLSYSGSFFAKSIEVRPQSTLVCL